LTALRKKKKKEDPERCLPPPECSLLPNTEKDMEEQGRTASFQVEFLSGREGKTRRFLLRKKERE